MLEGIWNLGVSTYSLRETLGNGKGKKTWELGDRGGKREQKREERGE